MSSNIIAPPLLVFQRLSPHFPSSLPHIEAARSFLSMPLNPFPILAFFSFLFQFFVDQIIRENISERMFSVNTLWYSLFPIFNRKSVFLPKTSLFHGVKSPYSTELLLHSLSFLFGLFLDFPTRLDRGLIRIFLPNTRTCFIAQPPPTPT